MGDLRHTRGPSSRGRARLVHLVALYFTLLLGCDFGIAGGGGCLRVSQGDYTFPIKRVLPASVEARLTASGIDFLTARIKALVLSFFDADADGRAIIPLDRLGLGAVSTSLGPFDAEVRDLVLTVDLSRLDVRLIPQSSPARIEVYVENAEVGLVDGAIVGSIDSTFFTGDAACALANGNQNRIARLTMRLVLELQTDAGGLLDIRVLPSSFDLQDISLALETDCDQPQCLDGRSPGDSGECLECETICPVVDFASDIASGLRSSFDNLFDRLLDLLADDLANLVLDGFLNGRPLAVEGELDIAALLGPMLSWMDSARPLGLLMKPAGSAFAITGENASLGLDVVLDAGLDASPHPCIGQLAADRNFSPSPRPLLDGLAQTSVGPVPYEVGLALSEAIVNEAIFALWKSGALCIRASSQDLASLTEGGLVLDAATLDLLLPGIAELAGPDAPIRISVAPRLEFGPDYVAFGDGDATPHIGVSLTRARVSVEALIGEAWLTALSFEADLQLGLDLQPLPDNRLELLLSKVAIAELALPDNDLFENARLEVIAPFVVELALGFLTETPLTFDLGLDGIATGFGVPIEPTIAAIGPAGTGDWLGIYIQLKDPDVVPRRAPRIAPLVGGPGYLEFRAFVPDAARFQVRVASGRWSKTLVGPGPHRLEDARLWLVRHSDRLELDTRAIGSGPAHQAGPVGSFSVLVPSKTLPRVDAQREVTLRDETQSQEGCATGTSSGAALSSFLVLAVLSIWRSRSRRLGLLGLLFLQACAPELAPERRCASNSECDEGFSCSPAGFCLPSQTCESDEQCCPGSVCFSGQCRPTTECDAGRPCEGLGEVCENAQCIPTACDVALPCPADTTCVAGRCIFGLPCDGRCGQASATGLACELSSDRCMPANCECAGFGIAEVFSDGETCSATCRCESPPADPAAPGVDGRLVLSNGIPSLISYDPVHGDLVRSRFEGQTRSDLVLDGRSDPFGEAGPDVGARVALVPGNGTVDALYRDLSQNRVVHRRFDLETGAPLLGAVLPVDGLPPERFVRGMDLGVGRFSCLTRRADGTLAGLVFVPADPTDSVSMLVRIESRLPDPDGEAAWVATTVLETPLPPRSVKPCDNACGFASVCVLDTAPGAPEVCGELLDASQIGGSTCGACGPREACVDIGGVRACRTRVERRDEVDRLPYGEGLYVSCVTTPSNEVVASWYDADRRRLVAGLWPFGSGDREVVDVGEGRDPGRFSSIAASPDGIAIAYQEASGPELRFAEASAIGAPWRFRKLAAGGGEGAWARLVFLGSRPVIVAVDAASGEVSVFARGAGCWGETQVFKVGTYGYPDAVAIASNEVWVSALSWDFDETLASAHAPVLGRVTLPGCLN